jgi:hypothetical protein
MTAESRPSGALETLVREYLLQVVSVHYELFTRLFESELDLPPGIGDAFEDAANTYLDLADMVAEHIKLKHPPIAGG